MSVSKDAVLWGFRFFLGREPESEESIRVHSGARDEQHLAEILIRSREFDLKQRFRGLPNARMPLDLRPIEVETDATPEELHACLAKIKKAWEHLGDSRPHFSVLTDAQFLPPRLEESIGEFWASGEAEAEQVLRSLRRYGRAATGTCVEYGCGVGRVTTALARTFRAVHGYDISAGHLRCARQRAEELKLRNVELHECPAGVLLQLEPCDFFYSRIVFQHNPPPVIVELIRMALSALRHGGIAIFQVPTYIVGYRFDLAEWLSAEHPLDMQMHCLPQSRVFELIAEHGCVVLEVREDNSTGSDRMVSNTFVVRRSERRPQLTQPEAIGSRIP